MLIATLAAVCWMGVAADPSASSSTQSSSPYLSGHEAEILQSQTFPPPHPARLAFQGCLIATPVEAEAECCGGLGWLGEWLLSTICPSHCVWQQSLADDAQASGTCAGRSTTVAGELLQATCVAEGGSVQVYQAHPYADAAIRITGAPASARLCPQPCTGTASVAGECCEACPLCAEGVCHIRGFAVRGLAPQPRMQVFSHPCEPVATHEAPWINAFILPSPTPEMHFAPPHPNHPVWFSAHDHAGPWGTQPEQPVDPHGRITHLQEAARHLEAAGMHAEAQAIRHRADEMQHHAQRLLEEKEAQLRQLQQEIEALRQCVGADESAATVMIPSTIFRVSPQGLAAMQEHGFCLNGATVNRREFQDILEKLQQAGMVELLERSSVITMCDRHACFISRFASAATSPEGNDIECQLVVHPRLHEGCCQLEVHPTVRTTHAGGLSVHTLNMTAELDPSQGLLVKLSDDGSVLAFITWEHAVSPQPTAAAPEPVTTERALVPASAEVWHGESPLPPIGMPGPHHLMVTPVFPQPFPTRVPQHPRGLQGHPVPPSPAPSTALPPATSAPR